MTMPMAGLTMTSMMTLAVAAVTATQNWTAQSCRPEAEPSAALAH
jgi:hypothetical protein